jgi:hypothetical protein
MQKILTPWKALSSLTMALGIALPAFAAQPATPSEGFTCLWGDASFEESCANTSAAAYARATDLAQQAKTKVASVSVTPAYQGTLYRNGGYFGDKNSDYALERTGN